MRARRLCRLILRCWMSLVIILGLSSHSYNKRLRHSRFLQIYSWLMMTIGLGLYIPFWGHARAYFAKGTFRRQGFVLQMSEGSVIFQLLPLIIHLVVRLKYERQVCQIYNELSDILDQDLGQKKQSRFYYIVFFGKVHNYLHNFNFVLGILMIVDKRTVGIADVLANIYFVYSSVVRESALFAYFLLLLDFSEALRLNSEQKQDSYGKLMAQLRRQERLLFLERQVHRIFAWLVASSLLFQMFYNLGNIYLGYAFIIQRQDDVGLRLSNLKIILSTISLVVKLSDCLLLQIVCEHLLGQEKRQCGSPQVCDQDAKATERQWELSILRRAIREASKDKKVLGLFRMDMRCAFALLSSSLSYGIIIIQMGYVHV
ncbi:putative gustatory receptor 10b [Drosophila serrata]|uniref:putative gustatory receptor 10b n=1 Tax=Drosophila serrata TaxID=7274 RepID=UPI000A1D3443|nr:putative gustatory receptor 10b [Drosophila serrata]